MHKTISFAIIVLSITIISRRCYYYLILYGNIEFECIQLAESEIQSTLYCLLFSALFKLQIVLLSQ